MCAQCIAGAAAISTGAGITGVRAWLGTRRWSWLSRHRLRYTTLAALAACVVATGTVGGGSPGPDTAPPGPVAR